jgi:hypothetical protein
VNVASVKLLPVTALDKVVLVSATRAMISSEMLGRKSGKGAAFGWA